MTSTPPLGSGAMLLSALERTGPHPVLAWYGEAARIELSGHVLANWVIKSIGHLDGELAFQPSDSLLVDLPPHWKRLVLALAAWSMGGSVHVVPDGPETPGGEASVPSAPQVVATDRPDSDTADAADEVLALEAVSLAPRFGGELPPLVHDWAAEVRAFADQLGVPLPAWSGPQPLPASGDEPSDAASETSETTETSATSTTQPPPRLLVAQDGLESASATLAALLAGGGIVGPAAAVSAQQAREEGVTARA